MGLDQLFPPIRCLKSTIFGGTIATVVVGLLSVFVVVYAFLISSIWTQFNRDVRNELIIGILCCSLIITLIGVSGIYGITNNKPCCLCLYSLGSIVFMLLFVMMGLFTTFYPKALVSSCTSDKSQEIQKAINEAQSMLCKTCGCYFITMNTSVYEPDEQKYLRQNLGNASNNQTSWPVNAPNCSNWNDTESNVDTLELLEGMFSCSGWCDTKTPNLYYLFTDINQGKPKDFCYNVIVQFFDRFGSYLEISSYSIAFILFFVFVTLLCLCCHPKRLNQDVNISLKQRLLQINATLLEKNEDE